MNPYTYRQLSAYDVEPLKQLLEVFGVEFGAIQRHLTYTPDESHVRALLARPNIIALVAEDGERVVGGMVAYEIEKFEKKNAIYIYDLAVASEHRGHGVVLRLVQEVRSVARERGVEDVFLQTGRGDKAAVRLHEQFGKSEEPFHFDFNR